MPMVPGGMLAILSSSASTALTTWPGMAKAKMVIIEGVVSKPGRDAAFRGLYRGRGLVDGAGGGVGHSQQLSVPGVDDMAVHGEGGDGDHRGCGLQAEPWTLPSEAVE